MAIWSLLLTAVTLLGPAVGADRIKVSQHCVTSNSSIDNVYSYSEKELNSSRTLRLSKFSGKVVLIVNVATYWGFTYQYHELNALQAEYPIDLAVLAFPCNQFGQQEPGATDLEILNGIRYVRPGGDFQPNITLFRKVDVNGAREHPLFTYLKRSCPTTRDFFMPSSRLDYSPMRNSDVRWNFEKFLVNRKGRPVKRYDASSRVSEMREDIESLISLDVNDPNVYESLTALGKTWLSA